MDFSHELFGAILDEVRGAGYEFQRFDDLRKEPKRFYLRHDVDISPPNAVRLAEIAASKGIRSNFFFQLNAETYQLLAASNLSIVKRIRELGHAVGLHIDEMPFGTDDAAVAKTLAWFSSCCVPIDAVVSFHRPTNAVLGKRYSSFINAYGPDVFGEDKYLSDSRRSLEFLPRLREWLKEGRTSIQLLLHPEWWYSVGSVQEMWDDLRSRRESELVHYLVHNFSKVFGPALVPTKRDYPL